MCDVANSLTAETLTVRSTLAEVNTSGAETPDLSRFYKARSRDISLIETAKKNARSRLHPWQNGAASTLAV